MRCASLVSGLLAARAAAQLATFKQCHVRVEALERGGGCLAVDAAAVNATLAPPEGTTACDDSATWTDGTNGCARYASNPHWCDEYRALGAWRLLQERAGEVRARRGCMLRAAV